MRKAIHNSRSELTARLFGNLLQTNILTKISSSIVGVIDLTITGRFLGYRAMAANGYAAAYFFVITLLGRWMATGCQNQCAERLGKGQVEDACNTFSVTFVLTAAVSVLIAAAGLLFPGRTAILLGAGYAAPEVHALTAEYLSGLFPGAPFFVLSLLLIPMLQLDGDSRRVRIATVSVALADIIGDLLNVYVFHGGMFGMGLATSISQLVQFLILFSHFFVSGRTLQLRITGLKRSAVLPVVKEGWPQALQYTGHILLPLFLNRYAFRVGGEEGVAALTVMRNAGRILCIYGESIFGSVLMLGKTCLSEYNHTALRRVEELAIRRILIGCGLIAVCAVVGAPVVASLYLGEAGTVHSLATDAIRIYALSLPFQALVAECSGLLLIFGYVFLSSVINTASTFVLPLLLCVLIGNAAGMTGIWIGFTAASILLYVILVIAVHGKRGILQQCRGRLNDPNLHTLEVSICDMRGISEMTEKIHRFCLENGIDPKRSFHISLCFEELSRNVLQHGFDPGKNNHLESRVIILDGVLTLRMRDDCRLFDFKSQMDEWNAYEFTPEKGLGIRIVRGMARNVVYTGTMKTNNLMITI